ncbi:MAG: DUF1178 family protein [Pseudomonadota bacterium]
MIKYALKCSQDHQFEGWFSNSADFDAQKEAGQLECPACGTSEVTKALMAPAVSTSRKAEARKEAVMRDIAASAVNEAAKKAKDYVEKNFDHVGKQFPEEARKIHYGETEHRAIYGEATPKEAKELKDEGVEIAPVPQPLPEPSEVKRKLN